MATDVPTVAKLRVRKVAYLIVCTVGSLILACVLVLSVWPSLRQKAYLSQVHPAVASLREPLLSLAVVYYFDGGSLAISITDADGRKLQAALPIGETEEIAYPRLFLGTNYVKQVTASGRLEIVEDLPGVVEVENPHHTMLRLQELLDNHEAGDRTMIHFALAQWRGDVRDKTIAWGHAIYRLAGDTAQGLWSNPRN